MRPFDALPAELTETLAGLLTLKDFREGEVVPVADAEQATAYIVLDGEIGIEIDGKQADSAGPGTLVGLLAFFVPELVSVPTLKARTDVRCLALKREDVDHLRTLSPAFDQACRELASERIGRLEQHLITRLSEAVEWTRSAAEALRHGREAPALAIRRAHAEHTGSPLAVWLGILLDGIPESVVIGAGLYVVLVAHPAVETLRFVQVIPYTLIAGLFLSNFPEALSSSANMLTVGWTRRRIFLMWFAPMVTTAIGAGLGFLLAGVLNETWLVFAEGVAAGGNAHDDRSGHDPRGGGTRKTERSWLEHARRVPRRRDVQAAGVKLRPRFRPCCSACTSHRDDPVADSILDQFGCALQSKYFENVRLMCLGRSRRDLQNGRDLFGRAAFGNKLQDFALTCREPFRRTICVSTAISKRVYQFTGNGRSDISLPAECFANGGDQLGCHRMLENKAGSPNRQRSPGVGDVAVLGQKDDLRCHSGVA